MTDRRVGGGHGPAAYGADGSRGHVLQEESGRTSTAVPGKAQFRGLPPRGEAQGPAAMRQTQPAAHAPMGARPASEEPEEDQLRAQERRAFQARFASANDLGRAQQSAADERFAALFALAESATERPVALMPDQSNLVWGLLADNRVVPHDKGHHELVGPTLMQLHLSATGFPDRNMALFAYRARIHCRFPVEVGLNATLAIAANLSEAALAFHRWNGRSWNFEYETHCSINDPHELATARFIRDAGSRG